METVTELIIARVVSGMGQAAKNMEKARETTEAIAEWLGVNRLAPGTLNLHEQNRNAVWWDCLKFDVIRGVRCYRATVKIGNTSYHGAVIRSERTTQPEYVLEFVHELNLRATTDIIDGDLIEIIMDAITLQTIAPKELAEPVD